jgi:hypothetical protein
VTPYLTCKQAAERLGMSERWLHERARLSEVPHRVVPHGRRLLFQEDWLEEWADGAALERVDLPAGGRIVRPVNGAHP